MLNSSSEKADLSYRYGKQVLVSRKVNTTGKNRSPHLEPRNDDKANLSKEISSKVVSKLLYEMVFGGVRPSCSFATVRQQL